MIAPEREAEIKRLFHAERWRVNTIATQLGIHHTTVERVLRGEGLDVRQTLKPSIADPFVPMIVQTLEKFPRLTATRLYEMVKERGYTGGQSHFRHIVSRFRPRKPAEAYLRLRTLPGEQAQMDWAYFGKIKVGQAERRLVAFVMVLSWSRAIFLRFYLGEAMPNFVRGHVDAFSHFGAVPRVILYDNLRSAVLSRVGDAVQFNPTLLSLAAHYRYEPRPVAPYRGNEKGRVERAIFFARQSFFAGRSWRDLHDLNRQALDWCNGIAGDRRCPENQAITVRQAVEQEKPVMLAPPDNPFPSEETTPVKVGKTPYVRFDGNDYSIPHTLVQRTLTVSATVDIVRILDASSTVAAHPRSYDKGKQIEDPAHIAALVERKKEGRKHRAMDRLHHAVPGVSRLYLKMAEHGQSLGAATNSLLRMLDLHGAQALERAIDEAVEHDVPSLADIHQILDRFRHEQEQGPPVPVALPDDPRVRNQVVRPHSLAPYGALTRSEELES